MGDAYAALKSLDSEIKACEGLTDDVAEAESYKAVVIPAMNALRTAVDSMEEITSSEYWPLPSYGEILFGVR